MVCCLCFCCDDIIIIIIIITILIFYYYYYFHIIIDCWRSFFFSTLWDVTLHALYHGRHDTFPQIVRKCSFHFFHAAKAWQQWRLKWRGSTWIISLMRTEGLSTCAPRLRKNKPLRTRVNIYSSRLLANQGRWSPYHELLPGSPFTSLGMQSNVI